MQNRKEVTKMNKGRKFIAVIGMAIISLFAAAANATSPASHTPLYTFRMEQKSSQMNFLTTEMNSFTYGAEKDYNLNYDILGCCNVIPLATVPITQCESTCPITCEETCEESCGGPETCSTCDPRETSCWLSQYGC